MTRQQRAWTPERKRKASERMKQAFAAANGKTKPSRLTHTVRDRMWFEALLPEGAEIVQRVMTRFLSKRGAK